MHREVIARNNRKERLNLYCDHIVVEDYNILQGVYCYLDTGLLQQSIELLICSDILSWVNLYISGNY